ncbi:MAG: carboxymuconolactone decarboxylase family protein [Rhodospirillales bacterium]|nr:carboxymuconolactone decarboxylase family protein [Rhodospirillales bacterium]
MKNERYLLGEARRREVLGDAYVDKALAEANDFSRPFQEMVPEYCWGGVWGDPALDKKTRSLINLGMIAALNRMHEWELHFRGAIKNGATADELRTVLHQIAIYCGAPAGVECFRIAKRVLAEKAGEV